MSNNPANARKAEAKRLQDRFPGMKYTAALRQAERARGVSAGGMAFPIGDPNLGGTLCEQSWIVEGVVRACEAVRGRRPQLDSGRQDLRALGEVLGAGRAGRRVTAVRVVPDSVTFDAFGEQQGVVAGRAQVDVWVTVEDLVPDRGGRAVSCVPTRWWLDVETLPTARLVRSAEVLRVRRGVGASARKFAA